MHDVHDKTGIMELIHSVFLKRDNCDTDILNVGLLKTVCAMSFTIKHQDT